MKSAILDAALAAALALGGAARRDFRITARANSGVRPWKGLGTREVPFAAPSLGPRPFAVLLAGCPGTKIRNVTNCLAISPEAVARTNRPFFGGRAA